MLQLQSGTMISYICASALLLALVQNVVAFPLSACLSAMPSTPLGSTPVSSTPLAVVSARAAQIGLVLAIDALHLVDISTAADIALARRTAMVVARGFYVRRANPASIVHSPKLAS